MLNLRWKGRIIALEGQHFRPVADKRHSIISQPGFYWVGDWKMHQGEFRLVRQDEEGALSWKPVTAELIDQVLGRAVFPRYVIDPSELPTPQLRRESENWELALLKAGRLPHLAPLLALECRKVDYGE